MVARILIIVLMKQFSQLCHLHERSIYVVYWRQESVRFPWKVILSIAISEVKVLPAVASKKIYRNMHTNSSK